MKLSDAFFIQAEACKKLGSPFMHRLLTLCGEFLHDSNAVEIYMRNFEGDIGPSGHSLPLRFAGGLHALKRQGYEPLVDVYPPNDVPERALWDAIQMAMFDHEEFLLTWLQNAPQTNEVRRSGVLLAGANVVQHHFPLPLNVMELGASAGLNLNFDRFAVRLPNGTVGALDPVLTLGPEWRGEFAPNPTQIDITRRRGCDLSPIDPISADGQLRLLSYLWPDQPDRIALTQKAISVARTEVTKMDALGFLQANIHPDPGSVRLIYHTVAWQYFPQETQDGLRRLMETQGNYATHESPLAWLSMEADREDQGAAIVLRLWPGDLKLNLGRADFHGRWIEWYDPKRHLQ